MTDALMPDLKQHVLNAAKSVEETKPKSETEKREEIIHNGRNSHFWQRGLKPYLEKRIENLRALSEAAFTGNETLDEIGARFIIGNTLGQELQDLINMVEVVADEINKKEEREGADKNAESR